MNLSTYKLNLLELFINIIYTIFTKQLVMTLNVFIE